MKKFDKLKHIKSLSRATVPGRPTVFIKNKKHKIKLKEAEKEILEYR